MNLGGAISGNVSPGSGGRTQPAYSTIYSVLRDHLDRNALRAGLVLGQANIGRAFNVSRVPAGIALNQLLQEGLIETFQGRGYIVPGGEPLRIDLTDGGLNIPADAAAPAANRREQIYPEVEHAVAVCLAYGRFVLNETALAAHYDVSRTIAHEVLTQLERAGVIEQDNNNRWYAGPLTATEFKYHFEMRILLEPQALRQAFPHLKRNEVQMRLRRIQAAERDAVVPAKLEELEADLHIHTLQSCTNTILLNTLRRSQRLLIATHSTFAEYRQLDDIAFMASEHAQVYEALLNQDVALAASALEAHLERSVDVNVAIFDRLGSLPSHLCPPYLALAKAA
ncbi:GntR family transcriptional regulator [Rhizobium sp. A37_96]